MIWLFLFLALFFGVVFLLPIRVEIDTQQDMYQARWGNVVAIRGIPDETGWHWFFRLFFWQMAWIPKATVTRTVQKPAPEIKTPAKKKMPVTWKKAWRMGQHLLKAVAIKRFRLNWDTGDFLLNAWLYPAFQLANRENLQWQINFSGKQELAVTLQTRLGRVAVAVFRGFFNR